MKKYQIGRTAMGRRVNLIEFVRRQRQRTRSRLLTFQRRQGQRRNRRNPFLSMGLAKETWKRRADRKRRTTYMAPMPRHEVQKVEQLALPGTLFIDLLTSVDKPTMKKGSLEN